MKETPEEMLARAIDFVKRNTPAAKAAISRRYVELGITPKDLETIRKERLMNVELTGKPDNEPIKVLDYGLVRLVDHMGNDTSIARSARVSYNAEKRAGKDKGSDAYLLNRLYSSGHNTPFEAVTFTFEIKAPIFVIRQWHRHRTQSYNEVSARYTELPEEFYIPELDQITTQHKDNKQMRTKEQNERAGWIREHIICQNKSAFTQYKALLAQGTPRELARTVLPLGTYTHMFTTMNLHNLLKFIGERDHEHAQYEIQVYARAMLELISPIVPAAVEAFERRRA